MHRLPELNHLSRRSYRPVQRLCPACQTVLKRHHILWRKTLVLLAGPVHITSWGYRCPNPSCAAGAATHRSAEAEQLHVCGRQFGRDVMVQIGYWRFWQHLTVTEIHERLTSDLHLPVAERQVLELLGDFLALLRAAQPAKISALAPQLRQLGGLIVGIDGMQPEKGNLCLYIVREPRLGLTLLAENLDESSSGNIQTQLLTPLKALAERLTLPILGVVSDAQETIQLAVAASLPGVPHHCCHYHCLRDAGSVTFAADRALKTDLKQVIRRALGRVEASIGKLPAADPVRPILTDYADLIHATLLEGGVAPFELGGIQVFDDLHDLAASLRRCQEKGGTGAWFGCSASPICASPLPSNGISWPSSANG
jgi:hypothetical protein